MIVSKYNNHNTPEIKTLTYVTEMNYIWEVLIKCL